MVTKIMPLGASNTYGMYQDPTSPGGYRGPLYDLLTAQSASFDFVGLDKDGALGDADHNGYSGKPIDWFTKPVNEAIYDKDGKYSHTINSGTLTAVEYFIQQAQMTSTDVILLLVGTNDVRLGDSAETMLAEIQVLLDLIVNSAVSPLVQLMKLQPIGGDYWKDDGDPDTTNNETIAAFNAGLEKLAAEKYGALGVTLVDSGVTETVGLSTDGVHMNETGYRMMAQAWYDSLTAKNQVEGPAPTQPSAGINGTAGDDILFGTDGDDVLNGYAGADNLTGGLGHDKLLGGDGSDVLNVDDGNDTLDGGAGIDWVKVLGTTGATLDLALTSAQATGYGSDTLLNIENASGGSGADTLLGSEGVNILEGQVGADQIVALGGNDTLRGGADDDNLDGGAGNDLTLGETGNDTFVLDAGDDTLDGGEGTDWLRVTGTAAATIDLKITGTQWTGYGTDRILNIENVTGGAGVDKIYGSENTVNILEGRGGDDVLYGRTGADTLNGGAGKDTLYGGVDTDRDVFVFASTAESVVGNKRDVVYDFKSGTDDIDLSGMVRAITGMPQGEVFGFSGTTADTYAVWYAAGRSEVIVRADVNGDRTADFEIRLVGVNALSGGDFIF